MSRKAKNTNQLYFEDKTSITFTMLPDGYFYKGKYYTVSGCIKALIKDQEITKHVYLNGTWHYRGLVYNSLKEIYENNEEDFGILYGALKSRYQDFNIHHNTRNCVLWSYDKDEFCQLFDSEEEVIGELKFYVSEYRFLADTEEYEGWFLDKKTKEECVAHFKKSIKERIKALNEWEEK